MKPGSGAAHAPSQISPVCAPHLRPRAEGRHKSAHLYRKKKGFATGKKSGEKCIPSYRHSCQFLQCSDAPARKRTLVENMPRILIAEDRASMRNTLRNLFTLYSKWDVCGEAIDGQQAVEAAVALKPDLVLLDYKMPNGDGIQAASEIKQKLPETPVVIFTLYKTSELESQARLAGVRAVVGKEEGVIKLLNTIESQLTPPVV